MRMIRAFPFIFSAMLSLSGCSSTSLKENALADKGYRPPEPVRPCCVNPDRHRNEHDDPASILAKRSIYFDYDQYVIKDEFRPLVEAHAKYLANHREIKVYVSGNTDARGGREYNVALGQKRAESVHAVFSQYGVSENQLEVFSFGAEQPKAQGNDETAWAENRRVDIRYLDQ
jgi:peptidoglycan-associated lipoprotein